MSFCRSKKFSLMKLIHVYKLDDTGAAFEVYWVHLITKWFFFFLRSQKLLFGINFYNIYKKNLIQVKMPILISNHTSLKLIDREGIEVVYLLGWFDICETHFKSRLLHNENDSQF